MNSKDSQNKLHGSEVAIIGMAGRFPKAKDVETFWQNLRAGVDAVTFFRDDELRTAGVEESLLRNPKYVKARMVLEEAELFDAAFFGYTPREAELMDPQHRAFLECARTAMEHAGHVPESYRGLIGVFAGAGFPHYFINNVIKNRDVLELMGMLQATLGNESDSLASMVSYKLNLKGPSIGVQSFCSTSLVAVHLACQSLLTYECDMAMAGGVAIDSSQNTGYLYQAGGIASPDGHCRTFDAKAQGSIYGSGVGIVVLKRLEDAIEDGDTIYAVIKGSATNNDGSLRAGYTAPGLDGQSAVVVEAMAAAGVESGSISYIETHGTATPLGDSIELAALMKAFRGSGDKERFCAIGSVKPNVGHLDRAAGVANLIKVALALRHKELPPSLYFEEPNPDVAFEKSPFYVNTTLAPWEAKGGPRRAGVSSFGLGGTNAHAVLEEWAEQPSGASRVSQLLLISAKTESSLTKATENLVEHFRKNPEVSLADAAFTLQLGRGSFNHRRVVVCGGVEEAIQALDRLDPLHVSTAYQVRRDRPVVFLFPGVGEQYGNMAAGLYEEEGEFRTLVDECCELLQRETGVDLRTILFAEKAAGTGSGDLQKLFFRGVGDGEGVGERLNQTWLAQPAVFVIEYCLARLLMSWGIVPEALIGNSVGEYAAAVIAGVMSLGDGLRLVAGRGKLIEKLGGGAMLAVALGEEQLQPLLGEKLSIAISNGPKLTVVSGTEEAIAELEVTLQQKEMVSRRLQTRHAFHSRMMEPAYGEFVKLVETVELKAPQIPYISNVTGSWIKEEEARDAHYWARHMCQRVRFGEGISEILRGGEKVLVEVGPGQGLGSVVKQHPEYQRRNETVVISTMRTVYGREADQEVLLGALGKLWLAGAEIDWATYYRQEKRRRIPLPTYPFERHRFWIEPGQPLQKTGREEASSGKKPDVADWFYEPVWGEMPLRKPLDGAKGGDKTAHWLVFLDECGIGIRLVERLKQFTKNITTIKAGAQFSKAAEGEYVIHPAELPDYKEVVKELRSSGARLEHVVHLWNVTGKGEATFEDLQQKGFHSLLSVAKALDESRITSPIQFDIVTDQLYAVDAGENLCPGKATLLGPCKVIPQEFPRVTSRIIDVVLPEMDGQEAEQLVGNLFEEITTECADVEVSFRGRRRLVQSFQPIRLEEVAPEKEILRQGGVYLIPGGLGGVGLALAEMLARRFAAKVVLTGRKSLPQKEQWTEWLAAHGEQNEVSAKIRKVQALEEKGAEVMVVSADVADEERMREVLGLIEERFGALHGVFHAAGITDEQSQRVIQEVTAQDCELHFHPKVHGTLVLEQLLQGRDVDFCLLFSSLSATLGGPLLSTYAAANAFLDSFATHKGKAIGSTRWIAVNWDTWKVEESEALELRYKGLNATMAESIAKCRSGSIYADVMTAGEGTEALCRVLSSSKAGYLVTSTAELQTRLDHLIYRRHLRKKETGNKLKASSSSYYARPHLQTAYVPANSETEERIARIFQDVLGIVKVGLKDNYFELGGNSLVAIQVVAELQKEFDTQLSPIAIFEAPTVSDLARLLAPSASGKAEGNSLKQLMERRRKIQEHNATRSDIAIIGMSGRFPGASNIKQFWQNLRDGVESISFFTEDALLEAGVERSELHQPNYVKARPILPDIGLFDAAFFGYSPRDAELMDPQHRLLLESAWEALEDAGYDSLRYDGSIGVYAGSNLSFYRSEERRVGK